MIIVLYNASIVVTIFFYNAVTKCDDNNNSGTKSKIPSRVLYYMSEIVDTSGTMMGLEVEEGMGLNVVLTVLLSPRIEKKYTYLFCTSCRILCILY